jgi:hypothetical protein
MTHKVMDVCLPIRPKDPSPSRHRADPLPTIWLL